MQRNVITIATGKSLYIDMAINLVRSFLWWHPKSDIRFFLVTDRKDLVPDSLINKIQIISVKTGEIGEGFSSKLYLDRLAPEGQTLFIDSDCLIFDSLDEIFTRFKGYKVTAVGQYITKGEWFGDIKARMNKFGLPNFPFFNGGIYYLEKGEEATKIFECARKYEKQYDELGFVRLRNRPNDEVLIALALQLNNAPLLIDDGTIMGDLQFCPGKYRVNVLKGKRYLTNPPEPSPLRYKMYPFNKIQPVIVHFLAYYSEHYPYRREAFKLKQSLDQGANLRTEIKAFANIELPERIKSFLKSILRPVYHKTFGPREVKVSSRM